MWFFFENLGTFQKEIEKETEKERSAFVQDIASPHQSPAGELCFNTE